LLSENIKVKICRTVIMPVVLYGCGTWALTLWDELRLVFDNRVLRKIFGPRADGVTGRTENCITRSFMICIIRQILLGKSKLEE
jgi:hypothetical protein